MGGPSRNQLLMSIVVLNCVGLTPRLLQFAPRLKALAEAGWSAPMSDVLPAVTCTAQATLLTGLTPQEHGIVGNGWLYKDTMEVRFWQQSNHLIQGEPLYVTAKKLAKAKGKSFRCAKLFWWFNQGADVEYSLTPKPHYGIDGSKSFGITGNPDGFSEQAEKDLGKFPFFTFWGPRAGLPCTQWIANATAWTMRKYQPDLTMAYLPHLDYDPQRFGPSGCDMKKLVGELDQACEPILEEAKRLEAKVWVVSEYGHCDVTTPIYLNRILREQGLIQVRLGPFGEQIDLFQSRAFIVCDHQLAHVYVRHESDHALIRELFESHSGIDQVFEGKEREAIQLNHPRAGDFVLLAKQGSWFAYPFWLDDRLAPDYARCVAIHHKPGYDPAEMFMDPKLKLPLVKVAGKLLQKNLGLRMKMDVIPLDASIVRGSHGLISLDSQDGPLIIGSGSAPSGSVFPMTNFKARLLDELGFGIE
jgi:predicted AlkP superfamily pyrophosphatase or phosphodiesterase